MTAPSRQVLSIDAYVHQVERACADLPEPERRRIVADLKVHLQELPNPEDPLATLGSPVDYARDLRAAMGLPEAVIAQAPQPRRWWVWAVVVGAVGALVIAVGAVIVVGLFVGAGSTSSLYNLVPTTAATSAPPSTFPPVAPPLVGKPIERAVVFAVAHGVQVTRIDRVPSRRRPGTVIYQHPAAGGRVDPRVGITVHVAEAR